MLFDKLKEDLKKPTAQWIQELVEENERLRAALRFIYEVSQGQLSWFHYNTDIHSHCQSVQETIFKRAKHALEKGNG